MKTLKLFSFVLFLILISFTVFADIDNNIYMYFTLDESGTPTDSVGNAISVAKRGTPTFIDEAFINGGYYTATNYEYINVTFPTIGEDFYSYGGWVNFSGLGTDDGLMHFGDKTNGRLGLIVNFWGGAEGTGCMDAFGDGLIQSENCPLDAEPSINVYHHIACVWNGSDDTLKIYMNGILNNTCSFPGETSAGLTNSLMILNQYDGAQPPSSTIDEVFVSNKTLNAVDILEIYTEGLANNQYPFQVNVTVSEDHEAIEFENTSTRFDLIIDWVGGIEIFLNSSAEFYYNGTLEYNGTITTDSGMYNASSYVNPSPGGPGPWAGPENAFDGTTAGAGALCTNPDECLIDVYYDRPVDYYNLANISLWFTIGSATPQDPLYIVRCDGGVIETISADAGSSTYHFNEELPASCIADGTPKVGVQFYRDGSTMQGVFLEQNITWYADPNNHSVSVIPPVIEVNTTDITWAWYYNYTTNLGFYSGLSESGNQSIQYLYNHYNVEVFNAFDSSLISVFNVTFGSEKKEVNAAYYHRISSSATESILIESSGYYNYSNAAHTTFFNNISAFLFPRNATLNVSASSLPGGSKILNFTVSILGADGSSFTKNTTNGSIYFTVSNQTYNVSIASAGYADNYGNSVLLSSWTQYVTNYRFELYTENSFNITFRDESTLDIIDSETIHFDLISDVFSSNYSTTNGTLYIDLLTPTSYTFRYYGSGFTPRISSYELTADSYNEITLYLLSGGSNVTLYVYDQSGEPVEGATINIYRYTTETNSYFLINSIDTDFTGQAVTNLQLNTEFYKFFIYYNGVLKKQTAGAYITGTELTFEINIEDPFAETYYSIQDVDGYMTFNEGTDNFRFYFNDLGTSVSQGCLRVYAVNIAGETLYDSSCTSGSSALILVNVANVSGQRYVGTGYITIAGEERIFDSYSYTFKSDSDYGSFGVLLVIFGTILAATLMLWDPAISLMILPMPALIGSLPQINWINIPTEYAVGVEIMMIILAFVMKRRPF